MIEEVCTEPHSFYSLFNMPYSKDFHCVRRAGHLTLNDLYCQIPYIYHQFLRYISLCLILHMKFTANFDQYYDTILAYSSITLVNDIF